MFKDNEKFIAIAKKVARDQFNYLSETGEYPEECVSFEILGSSVLNPFIDLSARFPLSLSEAFASYGSLNMEEFMEEAYKKELKETFLRNYINQNYNYDCGTFDIAFERIVENDDLDFRLVFNFTHYTGDSYKLYAYLDKFGVLYILNDRGENILDYAEEYEWTIEDIRTIKYGPIERTPLSKEEMKKLGIPFLDKLSQTHMEVFTKTINSETYYTIEYYRKNEFGYLDETLFEGSKERLIEKFSCISNYNM